MKKVLLVLVCLVAAPAYADPLGKLSNEWENPIYNTGVVDKMSMGEKAFMRVLLIEFVYACNGKQSRLMPRLIAAHSKIDETIIPISVAARKGEKPTGLAQFIAGETAAHEAIASNGAALCEATAEWLTTNITPSQKGN